MDNSLTAHHLRAINSLPIPNNNTVLPKALLRANIRLNKVTVTHHRSRAHTTELPPRNPTVTTRPPLSLQQDTTLPPHSLHMVRLLTRRPMANRRKDMELLRTSLPRAVPGMAHPTAHPQWDSPQWDSLQWDSLQWDNHKAACLPTWEHPQFHH